MEVILRLGMIVQIKLYIERRYFVLIVYIIESVEEDVGKAVRIGQRH